MPQTLTGNRRALSSAEIRQGFLDFFAARGHTIVPSAPLVPGDDRTLLFTNSGMVQFKDVFLGTGSRPYTRAVDSQKVLRVSGKHNDLDDVGRDDSHHTFFEMLGNWSFGDYYKREAIAWAWELLTEVWGVPKERLWATCFEDEYQEIPRDDEAADNWRQQPGFDPSHLRFFGRKENFWEMADTGPCGPDSELHLDRGSEYCDKQDVSGHTCEVNGDCQRFVELWNLVFIQYNRVSPKVLEFLPKKHVDTGMGFERIVSELQGVDSNYKTDLFTPALDAIQKLAGHTDARRAEYFTPYRVIADHARSATFLIAEGVIPGNARHNYVTRSLIRRAVKFGREIGLTEPFLARVCEAVIETYREAYPEVEHGRASILTSVTQEEQRFQRTLDAGVSAAAAVLDELQQTGASVVPGEQAFILFTRHGLPLEILRDMARERGMEVDEAGFHQAMELHRLASGAGQPMGAEGGEQAAAHRRVLEELVRERLLESEGVFYDPYSRLEVSEPVVALLRGGQRVRRAKAGDEVAVILPSTCFYVEAGGQVSDTGKITGSRNGGGNSNWEMEVKEVRRPVPGLILHLGTVTSGSPQEGDPAVARVDDERRWDIMRNHTATHLIHSELRYILGEHVRQAGSLVAPDRLRFDFTHSGMLTQEELDHVAASVNEAILANYPVVVELMPREEAIRAGAMALFEEKYANVVRTIKIGEPEPFSFELCGGTHVPETADIGPFVLLSESGVAANVRRIEAVTGREAQRLIRHRLGKLDAAAAYLSVAPEEVDRKVLALLEEVQQSQKEIARLKRGQARQTFEQLMTRLVEVEGVPLLAASANDLGPEVLREMTDWFRERVRSGVIVLASTVNGRPSLIAGVTEDLVARGLDAVKLIREVAGLVGGGGGGRPTLAQAGGKDASRLGEALARVPDLVRGMLNGR